ncbi:hypothetical protein Shyd_75750 [Streptomyces hydrogenans]|uniref:Uncharacterized protein n=1 Tax=Streptomyces hydrogenans TaxID=1873719 RepID=A0ABQ3PME5_9ACTN|nr:hypothetical protein GCM10018784_05940 [Streptomyces hydrogenans]GHI26204.1 hypothetical protein Shyd_75750 [Streptomyces hydrogenans]
MVRSACRELPDRTLTRTGFGVPGAWVGGRALSMSRETRRTVAADEPTASVFDTVIVAGMVAAPDSGQGA